MLEARGKPELLLLCLAAGCLNTAPAAGPPRNLRAATRVAALRAEMGEPCKYPEGLYWFDGGRLPPKSVDDCDCSRELEIADLECKDRIGHADDDLHDHIRWWVDERHRYDACMDARFPGIVKRGRDDQHAMLPDLSDALYDAAYETTRGTYLLDAFGRDCAKLDAGTEKRTCINRVLAAIAAESCLARSKRDGGEWSAEQIQSCEKQLLDSPAP